MNINVKQACLLSSFAIGLAASALAQSSQNPSGNPPSADTSSWLVGGNYAEFGFGYQRQDGAPDALRDYQFVTNGAALTQGIWGLDGNFTYDYLYGGANGIYDYRDEAQFGVTNFIEQAWGRPFVTTDAGFAWQRAGAISRKSFAYTLTSGVEFRILKDLSLAPYFEYEAEPHLYNHELPIASLPDHLWYYGVMASYRISKGWGASIGLDLDQDSGRDLGYRAGVNYRF